MKYFFVICILSLSIRGPLMANDEPCIPIKKSLDDNLAQILNIYSYLDWHGANEEIIDLSQCKTKNLISNEEIKKFIKLRITNAKTKNATINGVSFSDESVELTNAFKLLTTAMDDHGFSLVPKNQKNFQKDFSINPECKKVICAVSKIWGEELGQQILYLMLKNNFNASEFAFEKSQRMSSDEMGDVLIGLDDFPKSFSPIGMINQSLTRYDTTGDSQTLLDSMKFTSASDVIKLYDTWSALPHSRRHYDLFHEVAHNLSTKLSDMDKSQDWLKLSGWSRVNQKWTSSNNECFVSQYATFDPYEDFAESVATYRYNPKLLDQRCMEKYEFIKKKVFKGREFIDSVKCD